MQEPIYVTGMGICSPIGQSLDCVAERIEAGESGLREIESFDATPMKMKFAGEVTEMPSGAYYPKELFRIWDRGTRMGMHAAEQAILDSKIRESGVDLKRIGVCIGTSGSGQYQNARFNLDRSLPIDGEMAFYLSRNSPHFQSSQIAAQLGLKGPNQAIGAATAGGGIALATALSWLRSGKADAVLAGGAESFSLLNVIGFDQLGLSAETVCTPFSGTPGMTFGEGAGYFVLESQSSALRRGARPHAILKSVAIRADGFDPILFDPSGGGLSRAIAAAIEQAGLTPADIDWIRASGTGGRDQDLAETLAIKSVFERTPPVSSIEPLVGHANGAGPAIGLVAAILCMQRNLIPQTLGCTHPRIGCDLDYVAEGNRHSQIDRMLCNTMAFGGTNCAIVVESARLARERKHMPHRDLPNPAPHRTRVLESNQEHDSIVITGAGIVSALGCGRLRDVDFSESREHQLSSEDRLDPDSGLELAGFVRGFSARKHCPAIKLRGIELLTQYAAASVSLALKDAGLQHSGLNPQRTGLVSAITRPSGAVFARLFTELQENGFRPLVGRLMLRNGRFMIASQLANWFDLRGFSSTISLGQGAGLHGLITAADKLRANSNMDAAVVLACDELSPMTIKTMHQSGILTKSAHAWSPYGVGDGIVPGEGATALVLERRSVAEKRGAMILAEIAGSGSTFDALAGRTDFRQGHSAWESTDDDGIQLEHALRSALEQSGIAESEIDLIQGHGSGDMHMDQRELATLRRVFGDTSAPMTVNALAGVCEATSSLLNVAAALSKISPAAQPSRSLAAAGAGTSNEPTSALPQSGSHTVFTALVTASSEQGHNAAVVLRREENSNFAST